MLRGEGRQGIWRRLAVVAACWALTHLAAPGMEAATTLSNSTNVTLNIAEAIEVVTWPDATLLLTGLAVPGEEAVSEALRFSVKCNSGWGIDVGSDEPAGRLREFDLSTEQYVGDARTSQQSLEWALSPSGPWTPLNGTAASIVSNQAATGEAGKMVTYFLRYIPGFNDLRLPNGHVYRIVLTYTATVGY